MEKTTMLDDTTEDMQNRVAADCPNEHRVMRLRRKIAKRDRRIIALEKKVLALESALGARTIDLESLSRNVERAVTDALCNVRMIPVFGHRDRKIIEVRNVDA